jgi:hypothetical protein
MQVPVLIEPISGNGFRARTGEPLALTAEGATAEEALQKLRDLVNSRLAAGARLVTLQVPEEDNPWLKMAGMYKDDPLFDEWQQAIAENRRKADQDAADTEVVPLEVPLTEHPLAPFAGMLNKDDPLVQEWGQIIAENRRKADEEMNAQ